MRHEALRSDQLPLPDPEQLKEDLLLPNHVRERFVERGQTSLDLRAALNGPALVRSRRSPQWRGEESVDDNIDLYVTFPFTNDRGEEDQGCLLIIAVGDGYLAKTFVSMLDNQRRGQLPDLPAAWAQEIKEKTQLKYRPSRLLSTSKVTERRPSWLGAEHRAEAWYQGPGWAIALQALKVGPRQPYRYQLVKIFFRSEELRRQSRSRWARRQKR